MAAIHGQYCGQCWHSLQHYVLGYHVPGNPYTLGFPQHENIASVPCPVCPSHFLYSLQMSIQILNWVAMSGTTSMNRLQLVELVQPVKVRLRVYNIGLHMTGALKNRKGDPNFRSN